MSPIKPVKKTNSIQITALSIPLALASLATQTKRAMFKTTNAIIIIIKVPPQAAHPAIAALSSYVCDSAKFPDHIRINKNAYPQTRLIHFMKHLLVWAFYYSQLSRTTHAGAVAFGIQLDHPEIRIAFSILLQYYQGTFG